MRIGLVGMGSIGLYLAKNLHEEIVAVDQDLMTAKRRLNQANLTNVRLVSRISDPLFQKCTLVVEAASQEAVENLEPIFDHANLMVMSVGAFTNDALFTRLKKKAKEKNRCMVIPSGAIGGMDVLQACGPQTVELTTRKHPKSLGRNDSVKTILFDGTARNACKAFPKNVNVAATISLAGIGFDKTHVRIISDPTIQQNTHALHIKGKTGEYHFDFQNHPFDENPKTSALAAHSALFSIKKDNASIRIG